MSTIETNKLIIILNDIKKNQEKTETTLRRMNNHISFVEYVFDKIKYPFLSLMNAIQYVLPIHTPNSITIPDEEPLLDIQPPSLGLRRELITSFESDFTVIEPMTISTELTREGAQLMSI